MGGVVPKGESNGELIDNLVDAKYIEKPENIKVLKSVDRADFFPGDYVEDAYRDMAMKSGNLHMSAPCIYCSMLENMEIEEGMSFLNIGSGTGYLSTLVGMLLGSTGTNHGIEIFQEVIDYANSKIDEFIRFSEGFNFHQFNRPVFTKGNMYCFAADFRKYDRVYCGARVPDEKTKEQLKDLVNPGGVLIIPYGENLMKYKKLGEEEWEESSLLSVQFSDLLEKGPEDTDSIRIYSQPPRLQELTRTVVLKTILGKEGRDVKKLESLPIPRVLIQYLKFYRDENIPKPESTKKRRRSYHNDSSDASDGEGVGDHHRIRVVIR